jgi:transcriptional antiterminator RfaH
VSFAFTRHIREADNPICLALNSMPILAAETSLFPGNLLDDFVQPEGDRRWWAIYTKSRQEKSLARQLLEMEVPFYLPLIPRVTNVGGRRTKSLLPLFGGYLFLYGNDEERVQALTTNRVAQAWAATEVEGMTRDLRQIQTLIASGVPLTTEGRLHAGQRVRVKSGSLMGLEGVIQSRRGEDRLLVAVQFLQQGVSIQINDYQLEPI